MVFFTEMKRYSVKFSPDGQQVFVHEGVTVLEAASLAGVILNSVCAGYGTCGKCHVTIEPEGIEVAACKYTIDADITVVVPLSSRFFSQRILEGGIAWGGEICAPVLQMFSKEASDTTKRLFGVSVDIGTTTVVAKLFDLRNGRCMATASGANPQMAFGEDVVSRISYASTEAGYGQLHESIITFLNFLIAKLCSEAAISGDEIYEVCVAGNTAMSHIFASLPVEQLGKAPYEAYSLDAYDYSADEMGVAINRAGNVHTIENISGFVGSDITSVALAVGFDKIETMTLVVDIGTNGELLLGTNQKLYAASCAAGPALEGAGITNGSRAASGAIESVLFDGGDICVEVIGGEKAKSICGSGLIDAVAVMLRLGIIDVTGRFAEKGRLKGQVSNAILSRMGVQNGQPCFVLASGDDGGKTVLITQPDIRQVQLANGAIRAGILLLENKLGIVDADIEQVFLAGAFGNCIRRESALRIGMLPDVPCERIQFVGNAACTGAEMVLLSEKSRRQAAEIVSGIEYVEIAKVEDFQTVFAECMMFPSQ